MFLQKLIDHACDADKRALMAHYIGAGNVANPSIETLEVLHDIAMQNAVARIVRSWIDDEDWQRFTKLS